jgi:hypothetical protein
MFRRDMRQRAKWKRDARLRERNGKADLRLPEIDVGLAIKFSAYFYKLTLPAGTSKQRGSFNPAVD